MSELKEMAFYLNLTEEDKKAFIRKCYIDGTQPAEVLEGFINDLIYGSRANGSDEMDYANTYYDRCGYSWKTTLTFSQWLMRNYGEYMLENILDRSYDIEEFKAEIAYLKEHPEEYKEGEIECLEKETTRAKEEIEEYYEEYKNETKYAENLEDGIIGIKTYFEMLEDWE